MYLTRLIGMAQSIFAKMNNTNFPPVVEATRYCPACNADWQGDPIPEASTQHYSPKSTHFSRLIGVEISGIYDGVHHWLCPQCHQTFPRWYEDENGNPTAKMFKD